MKKILTMIILSIITIGLVGCSKANDTLTLDAVSGSGSSSDPYVVEVYPDEFTVIPLTMPEEMQSGLLMEQVKKTNDGFSSLETTDTPGLNAVLTNKQQLVVGVDVIQTNYIKLTTNTEEEFYIEVRIMKKDIDFNKQLKVLAIGNSFSEDGLEYVYQIADDYGVEDITLGILYIGGAPLETHVNMLQTNEDGYTYYKNTAGYWDYNSSYTMQRGITDEAWDIITIQQASYDSGLVETYNQDIDTIIDYVLEKTTNKNVRIMWQMTWAYQSTSNHTGFVNYGKDQMTMYNAIINATQEVIVPHERIDGIIPSGTAIQNVRTSYIGDYLTRDGFHLSLDKGRYTAGLTWFSSITGLSINDLTYKPEGVSDSDQSVINEAVNNAIEAPYEITNSSFTEE